MRSVISDPYFAEVIGMALAAGEMTKAAIDEVGEANPLGLFCAMRHFQRPQTEAERYVVGAAMNWAISGAPRERQNCFLRDAVLRVLAECEGPHVIKLSKCVDASGTGIWSLRARFRNGDLAAGIRLCRRFGPGVGVVGHVELIEHVLEKFGSQLIDGLKNVLARTDITNTTRSGALRLAGFTGHPALSDAVRGSWAADAERVEILSDYLWAGSQCYSKDSPGLLQPIFDAWAAMSDEDVDRGGSPRVRFGADRIRWAFRDRKPARAIGCFLDRAKDPELRWPMLVMLNGIDDPDAIEFVVRELAQIDEGLEKTGQWSPFAATAVHEWTRRPKYGGSRMSVGSRQRLHELWSSEGSGRHLRRRAIQFWGATVARGDIAVLKKVDTGSDIGDLALFQRLERGDETAIPALVQKLENDRKGYWWRAARYVWSDELTECLDRTLGRIIEEGTEAERQVSKDIDWFLSERLMELPPGPAERLIEKHWGGLAQSAPYIQSALYLASPSLLAKVQEVVEQCDASESLFTHLDSHFGIRFEGRRGITRISQLDALLPYLDHLADIDLLSLWEACNDNRWFDWRRDHLDSRAERAGQRFVNDASVLKELDNELAHENPYFWAGHWGDAVLKVGLSLNQMMGLVGNWLTRRDEENALHMAVSLVTRFGKRRHVSVLLQHKSAHSRRGQQIIADAAFGLRLRSLE